MDSMEECKHVDESMSNAALSPPFFITDFAGIGGVIKSVPEDFEVEEVPAYEPCGSGDHLYLWIEKRDIGADFLLREVARRLGIARGDVGAAGNKDRRAITRQWLSVPRTAESRLQHVDGNGIRVLQTNYHINKLRTGHLRGNRFNILVRGIHQTMPTANDIERVITQIQAQGVPNFFGPQRFGLDGETLALGWSLIKSEKSEHAAAARRRQPSPFLRKLALSAVQSALFNLYLSQRLTREQLHKVLDGDVMSKYPQGGLFWAEDLVIEQQRFDRRETMITGPILGQKTFPAKGKAAEMEAELIQQSSFTPDVFNRFGKLMPGTRRYNLLYPEDLTYELNATGLRVRFFLPAGSYATTLLRELTKTHFTESDEKSEDRE